MAEENISAVKNRSNKRSGKKKNKMRMYIALYIAALVLLIILVYAFPTISGALSDIYDLQTCKTRSFKDFVRSQLSIVY